MALMRYIGPHDEVKVLVAGNEIGNVVQGGAIVVPDDLAASVAWSDELWEDASADSSAKEKLADEEKAHNEALSSPVESVPENSEPGKEVE